MKILGLLGTVVFLLGSVFAQATTIESLDILVYDAEVEEDCIPTADLGCIRLEVTLNNDSEKVYNWTADIGEVRLDYKGNFVKYGKTPNFKGSEIGSIYSADHISWRTRQRIPYFSSILTPKGREVGFGIYGRDNVIGKRTSQGSIAVKLKNMKMLHGWLKEVKLNEGKTSVTITASALSLKQIMLLEGWREANSLEGLKYLKLTGLDAIRVMGLRGDASYIRKWTHEPDLGSIVCISKPSIATAWAPEWVSRVINTKKSIKNRNLCLIPIKN